MSAKENAAINQLLALLEARYALRVLWALRDGHAQTFRLLQDSVGNITPNTLNTRIKELREAGVVSHGSDGYCLTMSGQDLLKRLSDLQAFAAKWQGSQAKKAGIAAQAIGDEVATDEPAMNAHSTASL
ncbi:winged helix-turn-helix transcriptional regulator [Variovorax sp. RHLX14]|uniref:winged helix-turn-helix transcriptional regulator n=1 Tax=Variovorax sp. RHLX14 TaxID=1259731 RepID=UPI003F47C68F